MRHEPEERQSVETLINRAAAWEAEAASCQLMGYRERAEARRAEAERLLRLALSRE
jgi:hypothetical protein